MTVTVLKSKLHRIRVTEAKLDYTGSLTVDEDLMDAVGILNNGAAAHKGKVGDALIVMTWAQLAEDEARAFTPKIGILDANNRLV